MDANKPVTFSLPILLYLHGKLSADSGLGLKALGAKIEGSDHFVCRSPIRPGFVDMPGWILESSGSFRELSPHGRRRTWAKGFSFLFQLVQSDFYMSAPQEITVGELMRRVSAIRDSYREAPLAADLKKHLTKFPEATKVSSDILLAWPI